MKIYQHIIVPSLDDDIVLFTFKKVNRTWAH